MEVHSTLMLDQVNPISSDAKQVGLARQFMSAELVVREDGWERGVRSVILQNDLISIDVVVDRALDIASARIRQLPIAWRSPTGIVAPWFVENTDYGPFRAFFGGLLTTCGLNHIGPPLDRDASSYGYSSRPRERLPMHGRVSGSPARLVGYGVMPTATGLEAYVEGDVVQVAVFAEHLILRRRISIAYGSGDVRIEDVIVNEGYSSTPLAVLYHVNVGWPVVAPGASIRPPTANGGGGEAAIHIRRPHSGNTERTRVYKVQEAKDGKAAASIVNPKVDKTTAAGVALSWDPKVMPTMLQWDIANIAGNYAIALEPTTLLSTGNAQESSFPTLGPGEKQELGLVIGLLHGPAGSEFPSMTSYD